MCKHKAKASSSHIDIIRCKNWNANKEYLKASNTIKYHDESFKELSGYTFLYSVTFTLDFCTRKLYNSVFVSNKLTTQT